MPTKKKAVPEPTEEVQPEEVKPIEVPYRKVCLVGSASSTLDNTPWKDESFEMWVLGWRQAPRAERRFDVHPGNFDKENRRRVPKDYEKNLAECKNCTVYLVDRHPEIPNSVRYPIEKVLEFFGTMLDGYAAKPYFASSVAYMIAMAILENVDEIHLYGLDFIEDGEYTHQRPNMEYFIGIARGRGIKVFIPERSALCEFEYVYGYQNPSDTGTINKAFLEDRLKLYTAKYKEAAATMHTANGARQEAEQLLKLLKHIERGAKPPDLKKMMKGKVVMGPEDGPGAPDSQGAP